jgi:hypothetical protein
MIFIKLFKKKQDRWQDNRQYLKSTTDLRLTPEQVIYVEGSDNRRINDLISERYDEIASKLKAFRLSAEFVYLPLVTKQLQHPDSLSYLLRYYFPSMERERDLQDISTFSQTDVISRLLFSSLGYTEQINPGLFRYVEKDTEGYFVYEYFSFDLSKRSSIMRQIDFYANVIADGQVPCPPSVRIEEACMSMDENCCMGSSSPKSLFKEKLRKVQEKRSDDLFDKEEQVEFRKVLETKCLLEEEKQRTRVYATPSLPCPEGYELITRIKSDIENLKELGLYELLIKEIGHNLFKEDVYSMFRPSRLLMDNDFGIYLPDFNAMEITMTPLPKALFILFLRHPEGINLKSLIDYKKELLEIYKLLSYRETYFDIVESINRICNPFEGSINEKLSRIKEAFLKKMSMDTAKYYIVTGERGKKKSIDIDRSLIELPMVFQEIELTKASE